MRVPVLRPRTDAGHVRLVGAAAVNAELDGVAVLDLERLALLAGQAEAHGVQEGAGLALGVLDVELVVDRPDLSVLARDDLAVEGDEVRLRSLRAVPLHTPARPHRERASERETVMSRPLQSPVMASTRIALGARTERPNLIGLVRSWSMTGQMSRCGTRRMCGTSCRREPRKNSAEACVSAHRIPAEKTR